MRQLKDSWAIPMTTLEKVKICVSGELCIPCDQVRPDSKLADLGDSLEIAALLIELESALGIEIPEDDFSKLVTVQGIVDYADSRSYVC